MAKKVAKGGIAAKLGSKLAQAHQAHKNDETTYSGGASLPDGIEHGIFLLDEAKFGQYKSGDNEGEYFFYAAGAVVEPTEAFDSKSQTTVRCKGLRTSLMVPICATGGTYPKTLEENYARFLNELRKLGVDTSDISEDDLESTVTALKDAGIYGKFRTYRPSTGTNPRVREIWDGVIEDYIPSETDAEEAVEEEEEEEEVEEEAEEVEESEEEVDLLALGKAADKKSDESAMETLTEKALEAGLSQDEIDNVDSWTALAEQLLEGSSEEEEEEAEEEEEEEEESWVPKKGGIAMYREIDPKTKKPKKAAEYEVIALNTKAGTADIKNLATKKVLKGVKISALSEPS